VTTNQILWVAKGKTGTMARQQRKVNKASVLGGFSDRPRQVRCFKKKKKKDTLKQKSGKEKEEEHGRNRNNAGRG